MAFRCLDDCLRVCMDQFVRVSVMATIAHRLNILDTTFSPQRESDPVLKPFPVYRMNNFAGKFQETMEAKSQTTQSHSQV